MEGYKSFFVALAFVLLKKSLSIFDHMVLCFIFLPEPDSGPQL